MKRFAPFSLVVTAGLIAGSAGADLLVEYDFSVLTGTRNDWVQFDDGNVFNGGVILDGSTEATVGSGLSASDLIDGGPGSPNAGSTAGLAYSTGDSANGGPNSQQDFELNMAGWDEGGTGGNDNYLEYVLTADAGNLITLTNLDIDLWRNGAGAPTSMVFEVSTDGITFASFDATQAAPAGGGVFANYAFTNAGITGTEITVRFAPFGPGGTGNIHINGLSADGSVAPIPEPSSLALLGLGGLLIARRRRA